MKKILKAESGKGMRFIKNINSIFTGILLLITILFIFDLAAWLSTVQSLAASDYESTIFDKEHVVQIDILMEESAWNSMIANASSEEYSSCDILLDGILYQNVGIRPKGNSSMSDVSNSGSERFSFRIKFDKYVGDQKPDGLKTLILNNGIKDPGNLHEAISYDMFSFLEADASLYTYAKVSVNGEYFGVYLALEGVDKSFVKRCFGSTGKENGQLYKPDTDNWGTWNQRTDDAAIAMGLGYVGDDLTSYQIIWDNAKFSTDSEEHHKSVVEALKQVSERSGDIDSYVDVENILKYMAVSAFIYNWDSLFGENTHNYYLYEENGKINLIPWDMNEAFSINGTDVSGFVNFPIDTPFAQNRINQRDFFMALLENETYLEQYHENLRLLSEDYVLGGELKKTIAKIRSLIDELVETDPTAFSTYDTYEQTVQTMVTALSLRAESVLGQIDGSIASTYSAQQADPDSLLDVSGAGDLSVLKRMNGTGGNASGEGASGGGNWSGESLE